MAETRPPMTWETSANHQPESLDSLPSEVVLCLQHAKYLALATCARDLTPHASLMSYTYLEDHPFDITSSPTVSSLPDGPFIIMTTNPSSRKTLNILDNPKVALQVNDWAAARTSSSQSSALAERLLNMNAAELGRISASINGTASVLERGSQVEKWCQDQHLRFNSFSQSARSNSVAPPTAAGLTNGQNDAEISLAQLSGSPNEKKDKVLEQAMRGQDGRQDGRQADNDDDVRVIFVCIKDGSIADVNGGLRNFVLSNHSGPS
ncbi:hypothetical protein K461DRAFT_269831 [Myriangium duriaei CBS 260.36]|uniref:Pyridoxamine 5'-phosphate oxidase N-terminal domain-containing protein n=1 Tax=Myriangium duriaei CBS 260.36 TaxID=1168546 RepID=A0A9P4MK27_9PEZI|nr:hypothetical protein K461DRAFT_269831 [Myriangium duriaei CBS 260.36]